MIIWISVESLDLLILDKMRKQLILKSGDYEAGEEIFDLTKRQYMVAEQILRDGVFNSETGLKCIDLSAVTDFDCEDDTQR